MTRMFVTKCSSLWLMTETCKGKCENNYESIRDDHLRKKNWTKMSIEILAVFSGFGFALNGLLLAFIGFRKFLHYSIKFIDV